MINVKIIHMNMKVDHLAKANDALGDYIILLDHNNLNNIIAFESPHTYMMQNLILVHNKIEFLERFLSILL